MATQTEFEILTPERDRPRQDDKQEALIARDPIALLQFAVKNNAAIDVIERLAALQREEREYQAKVSFDEALNRCQEKVRPISADAENPQTRSKYATYKQLDKAIRPIYTAEGFSISYSEKDCPVPGKTRFVAYLSRSGVTREYIKDLTPSTKGPQGKDVMTPIHADASADSYAKRYMLKNIFNIAIGEEDNDGNGDSGPTLENLDEQLYWLANCRDIPELEKIYSAAAEACTKINDTRSIKILTVAKARRAFQVCDTSYKGFQDQFSAVYRTLNGLKATEEIREVEGLLKDARKQRGQRDYR